MDWKELLEGKTKQEKGTDQKIQNGQAGTEQTGDTEDTGVEVPVSFKIYSSQSFKQKIMYLQHHMFEAHW